MELIDQRQAAVLRRLLQRHACGPISSASGEEQPESMHAVTGGAGSTQWAALAASTPWSWAPHSAHQRVSSPHQSRNA